MSFKDKKVAFVFPGQGSQYIGMGIDFYESSTANQQIFGDFQNRTGVDLIDIMRCGPEETLKETRFTQPAILSHSVMAMKAFLEVFPCEPDFVAGHSLGEFTALVANGVLDFADAMYLVHKRGEFMIKANGDKPFAMAALLGIASETVKEICAEVSLQSLVVAANYNTQMQTVISGTKEGVDRAGAIAKEKGAKRVIPLVVGGPFHSPLISDAAVWLKEIMHTLSFQDAKCPVISNIDALPESKAEQIVKNLEKQVTSPVLWIDTIKYLASSGVKIFIEFGPQKVLSGMIRQIADDVTILNIDKNDDIKQVISVMEEL
ncbi:MAG: ACP S-malonyltransferase [Candidatus Cloacimonetes bacterium]|nr:ACP S-malonyltransferase [Candidatus Cloacimonadota bacterium]